MYLECFLNHHVELPDQIHHHLNLHYHQLPALSIYYHQLHHLHQQMLLLLILFQK
jgi:hypothetical protein